MRGFGRSPTTSRSRAFVCHECLHRLSSLGTSAAVPQTANPFGSYATTRPPSTAQLQYATALFLPRDAAHRPSHLLNAPRFLDLPPSPFPEVAILGRSNVGKSSLLNALLGFNATTSSKTKGGAHVSKRPGATKDMNVFGVGGVVRKRVGVGQGKQEHWTMAGREGGGDKLLVLDMPGYASGSTETQGKEVVKYLSGRNQYVICVYVEDEWKLIGTRLRRVFVLIDARHGMKTSDKQILALLWENGIAHQLVLSKIDYVVMPRSRKSPNWDTLNTTFGNLHRDARGFYSELKQRQRQIGTEASDDILATSSEKVWPPQSGKRLGIEALRWGILEATGLDSDAEGRRRELDFNILADEGDISSCAAPFQLQNGQR